MKVLKFIIISLNSFGTSTSSNGGQLKEINWYDPKVTYHSIKDIYDVEKFVKVRLETSQKIISNKSSSLSSSDDQPIITKKEKQVIPNSKIVNNLYVMGFSLDACMHALKETKNNLDAALKFLIY